MHVFQIFPGLFRDGPTVERGVPGGRLLLDGDSGREPFDGVDVRLVHDPEELAGVSGERFDVPPLLFGVQRVERERRFPGPGDPGYHHGLVPGIVTLIFLKLRWRVPRIMIFFIFSRVQVDAGILSSEDWGR